MDNRNRGIPYRNPEGYTEWAADAAGDAARAAARDAAWAAASDAERAWQVEELKKMLREDEA